MSGGLSNKLLGPIESSAEVDSKAIACLKRLGVHRAVDLLFLFPRSYTDPAERLSPDQFQEDMRVKVEGKVVDLSERVTQSGKHMFGVLLCTDHGVQVRLMWFNQQFRRNMYFRGMRLVATGSLRSTGLNWEMVQPQTSDPTTEPEQNEHPQPVYPLTEGLKQSQLRQIMRAHLPGLISEIDEVIPDVIRERLQVPGIRQALHDVHFPKTREQADIALRRLKLQELLVLQLALAMQRREREKTSQAPTCELSAKVHARILNRLPYALTPDQDSAIDAIRSDMAKSIPMNRLLQGDVGSGKTLVAQYAMLLAVANELQAVLMAPTEVLARQHFDNLQRSLAHSRVKVGLFIGSLSKGERQQVVDQVASGEIDLLVGTQALLSDSLKFKRLGLVVVDEQHKFGVIQRARLRGESYQPHNLVLSATPIPRTIAMTAFGDLDVSLIKTKPPGRAPVHTYLATADQLDSWWRFVDKQIQKGRQAYVIAPRLAENYDSASTDDSDLPTEALASETNAPRLLSDFASAQGAFRMLSQGPLSHRTIGLLHGRMDSDQKESVLQQFASGQLQVLVATTVVEVGVDIPNATVITILDADRLGLSQLHQLRGRVARGSFPGYACAVASSSAQAEQNLRLKAFKDSDDGFYLAEIDLRIRGPGDLLGTSQAGMPTMRIANLVEDAHLLDLARQVAGELIAEDPDLANPELQRLIQQTLRRYGKSLKLGDVA